MIAPAQLIEHVAPSPSTRHGSRAPCGHHAPEANADRRGSARQVDLDILRMIDRNSRN